MKPKKEESEQEQEAQTPRPRRRSGTFPNRRAEGSDLYGGRWHHSENYVGTYVRAQLQALLHRNCGGVQKRLLEILGWPASRQGALSNLLQGERHPDLKSLFERLDVLGGGTLVLRRAEEYDRILCGTYENSAARLDGWDAAVLKAESSGVERDIIERYARSLVAVNSEVSVDFLTGTFRSRPASYKRVFMRLNKREPRLPLQELLRLVHQCFPHIQDFSTITSEQLAPHVSRATTIEFVEELPAPWVHDIVGFRVFVRETQSRGLNEHRACEALLAYALKDIEDIELSHEVDVAVWRLISSPAHEPHRQLRARISARCPKLHRPW